jgi:hypothetical protein
MDLQNIEKQLLIANEQIDKLKKGKKVAATHARQALLQIKKETDRLRKEVLEYVKNIPPKSVMINSLPAVESEEEIPPPVPLTRETTSLKKKRK